MKCLWKIVRMLPDTINELNLDRVLYDIHVFLRTFPSHTWRERGNDLPLRTAKTILHSMAKLKGSKILSHLGQIDAGEHSEVKTYLQKVLKNEGFQSEGDVNGASEDKTTKTASKTKRLSKTTHEMLTEIFKKVGSKEQTKDGLRDLYDFKKKFPDADIDPFLKKSSHFFQNYIERGLKAIENEEREKNEGKIDGDSKKIEDAKVGGEYYLEKTSKLSREKLGQDTSVKAGVQTDFTDALFYMERLRELRAQCGLDSDTAAKVDKPKDTPEITEMKMSPKSSPPKDIEDRTDSGSENESSRPPPPPTQSKQADVSQLKARLEKIKQMANS